MFEYCRSLLDALNSDLSQEGVYSVQEFILLPTIQF